MDSPSGRADIDREILDKLEEILEGADLLDAYRLHHPEDMAVTHSQITRAGQRCSRRLDYLFVSSTMAGSLLKARHSLQSYSDHRSVELSFGRLDETREKGMWRHNNLLNNQEFAEACYRQIALAEARGKTGMALWEMVKHQIGEYSQSTSRDREAGFRNMKFTLESSIARAEAGMEVDPDTLQEWIAEVK